MVLGWVRLNKGEREGSNNAFPGCIRWDRNLPSTIMPGRSSGNRLYSGTSE